MLEKIMQEARKAKSEADGQALIDKWDKKYDEFCAQGKHEKASEIFRAVESAKRYMLKTGAYWQEQEDIYAG